MNEGMFERARELGRLIGQTEEYKALQRARDRVGEDRELRERIEKLAQLEAQMAASLQKGEEPAGTLQDEYERMFGAVQTSATYQGLVAGESNFDKVLRRVNEEIGKGIESGSQSRIIFPG